MSTKRILNLTKGRISYSATSDSQGTYFIYSSMLKWFLCFRGALVKQKMATEAGEEFICSMKNKIK